MTQIIGKITNNPWWIFSAWILMVLGFFNLDSFIIAKVFLTYMTLYPWKEALEWILIGGAFWFGVHAYYRSTKYINERKDILDGILRLLQRVAKNEEALKRFTKTPEYSEEFKEMAKRLLTIKL